MRRWLQHGPLRPVTGRLSNLMVGGQLAGVRFQEALRSRPETPSRLAEVTALIKTFERPYAITRLLKSLERRYPELKIIVVDDSREPIEWPGVRCLHLPFDSGVSAGRQAGLEAIKTPFTLLLDDDFVAFGGTRIAAPLAALLKAPAIDLVAGEVIDLPQVHRQSRSGLWPTRAEPIHPEGHMIEGLPVTHKPPNFYLARTARLLEVGWDARVKRLDHADFFTRALGKLVCVQDDRWSILHARNPFDRHYQAYRTDVEGDRLYLAAKHSTARTY